MINYLPFNGIRMLSLYLAIVVRILVFKNYSRVFVSDDTKRERTSRNYLSLLRNGERCQDVGEGPVTVHVES